MFEITKKGTPDKAPKARHGPNRAPRELQRLRRATPRWGVASRRSSGLPFERREYPLTKLLATESNAKRTVDLTQTTAPPAWASANWVISPLSSLDSIERAWDDGARSRAFD
jgi:hypothetical protein